MSTFIEANQAKLSLKMTLSCYGWYRNMAIVSDGDDWCILVNVSKIDNSIRKIIPIVHNGITVKVDVENRHR